MFLVAGGPDSVALLSWWGFLTVSQHSGDTEKGRSVCDCQWSVGETESAGTLGLGCTFYDLLHEIASCENYMNLPWEWCPTLKGSPNLTTFEVKFPACRFGGWGDTPQPSKPLFLLPSLCLPLCSCFLCLPCGDWLAPCSCFQVAT